MQFPKQLTSQDLEEFSLQDHTAFLHLMSKTGTSRLVVRPPVPQLTTCSMAVESFCTSPITVGIENIQFVSACTNLQHTENNTGFGGFHTD